MSENTKSAPTAAPSRLARLNLGNGVGLLLLYIVMIIFIANQSPYFLGARNLVNLPVSVAVIGMIAVFSTLLMIGGGLDLSVGANTALVGVIVASTQTQFGIVGASAFGILIGALIGLINGLLVTRVGINPLITTLGMLSVVRGLAFVFSGGLSILIMDESFGQLGRGRVAGVPIIVIAALVMFVIAIILLHRTTYGRAMYAIGGNSRASYLAALPVKRYQLIAYVLSGLGAAIAGVFLTSRLGAAAPQASTGLELKVVAAIILGGTSLTGGKGNLFGTLLGVLILGTLDNAITLLSVSAYSQQIALGVLLLLAVGLDQFRVGNLGRLLRSKY